MTKKTRTEITPALKARVSKVKRKAREYLVKTEIVQFRLDEHTYRDLFSIAQRKRKPVGTLVREWVTEQTQRELVSSSASIGRPGKEVSATGIATMAHVLTLQKQIDELARSMKSAAIK